MNTFDFTDCWVLFSIGFNKRGYNLKSIIRSGDFFNHAIIERDELETSLNRLINNEYVYRENNKYFVTNKARDFYKVNKNSKEGHVEELMRISDVFIKQPFKEDVNASIQISIDEYEKAL